jgi:hypothetical protein
MTVAESGSGFGALTIEGEEGRHNPFLIHPGDFLNNVGLQQVRASHLIALQGDTCSVEPGAPYLGRYLGGEPLH